MNRDNLIQWPRAKYWDKAWNPVIGCLPCSPACEHCYAAAWAKRFGQSFNPHTTMQRPPRSGVVFCGNMTDLFGLWCDGVEIDNSIEYIGATLGYHDKATYLWLTKRVGYMCHTLRTGQVFLKDDNAVDGVDIFSLRDVELCNQYFGFTAENQGWYDERLREWTRTWTSPLRHINGWISCEPLLGPIDFHFYTYWLLPSWVVVGCESGPNRRPCKIEWVESIVDQCRSAKIPVFVKQLDIGGKCEHDIDKFPAHLRIRQVPWAKKGGANG